MKYLLLIIPLLVGCLPEIPDPAIPTGSTCTADGWYVDPMTGEIVTSNDTGAAIQCTFTYDDGSVVEVPVEPPIEEPVQQQMTI